MTGDVVDMRSWAFRHERAPARRLSDRELYLRALSRQKVLDDSRWAPADETERRLADQELLDRMIGAKDPFTGPDGDAA